MLSCVGSSTRCRVDAVLFLIAINTAVLRSDVDAFASSLCCFCRDGNVVCGVRRCGALVLWWCGVLVLCVVAAGASVSECRTWRTAHVGHRDVPAKERSVCVSPV